jgi:hypothetical protein
MKAYLQSVEIFQNIIRIGRLMNKSNNNPRNSRCNFESLGCAINAKDGAALYDKLEF